MENSKSDRSNTGYKGIYWDKTRGKFEIYLRFKRDTFQYFIGSFETLKESIKAREDFIKSLF